MCRTFTLFVASLLLGGMVRAEVVETDWCTIETPPQATSGQKIEVKVTLKAGVEPAKLAVDLQWMKKDGTYGGFLSWIPRQNAKVGVVCTFKFSPRLRTEMGTIAPGVYLSPDGDFSKRTKSANGKAIPVIIDPVVLAAEAARDRPDTATFKRSRLRVLPPYGVVAPGDTFEVKVEYQLDARDNWGDGTQIQLMGLGPWIDNPDGVYFKSRQHVYYAGLGTKMAAITPGEGAKTFSFKLGTAYRYNNIAWKAVFIGGDGKAWPWEARSDGPSLERAEKQFELSVDRPGGLFTYAEPLVVRLAWQKDVSPGASKTVRLRLIDADGHAAGACERLVTCGAPGTFTDLPLDGITARGVLLVEAEIEGWGTRDAFLARIPDVPAITGGKPTLFGATDLGDDDTSRAARKLGLTYCRQFVNWSALEPLRGHWQLEKLDAAIAANVAAGLKPWICLYDPPAWVLPVGVNHAGFEPFPFDADAWRESITTLARHYQDRIWGFEWLNEIVPGTKSPRPAQDYLEFCRIGTAAVHAVNPNLKTQLAGGLWPRNFRTDLLAAGIASTVDVMPVHYSDLAGVQDARGDLAAVGASQVAVWDNESSYCLSMWNMPAREMLTRSTVQSQWLLQHWPDELVGGAAGIIFFGGQPDPVGNASYLLDAHSPRPVAATLAVLTSKLSFARPIGKFLVEPQGVFHLFEHDGKTVLIAAAAGTNETRVCLPVGAASVLRTDYQGNETTLATTNGIVTLVLGPMPVFIEGGDLDTLATQAALTIGESATPQASPQIMVVKGARMQLPLRMHNPLDKLLEGTVALTVTGGWATSTPLSFALPPGGEQRMLAVLDATAGTEPPTRADVVATACFKAPALPPVVRSFGLNIVNPEALGNLLHNGGFEEAGASPAQAANWSGKGTRTPSDGGLGLGTHVLRFSEATGWLDASQSITVPAAGQSYLYTAWVWSQDMQAGSNLQLEKGDGTSQMFFVPHVFSAGNGTPSWRLLTHHRATSPDVRRMTFTPVVSGKGWAQYDNLRVTLDEGTDFAAEAHCLSTPIRIDGDPTKWSASKCPVPLLCDNQLTVLKPGYVWTPTNLSGVAYLAWDEKALYLAVQVRDDRHVATTTGEQTLEGDSLRVALHPGNRAAGADAQAFEWYVSDASPGGGSGHHTLYRPPAHSGGLSSGQLAKDSSVYEVVVVRAGDITTYELKIPWSEAGIASPAVGTKFGLSLQLNDNDGEGRAAVMTWGGGLQPVWAPPFFGVVTLVAP